MYLLIQYFKKYRSDGINEPEEVMKATREYQKMCDIYVEFADDTIEKHVGGVLKIEEMYQTFRVWYRENFDGKCPARRDFKEGIGKKLGKYQMGRNGGWHGWRFIPQIEDEDQAEDMEESSTPVQAVPKIIKKDALKTPNYQPELVQKVDTIKKVNDMTENELLKAIKPKVKPITPKISS